MGLDLASLFSTKTYIKMIPPSKQYGKKWRFGPGYSSRNGHYSSPHSLVCNNGWGSVKIVSTPALLKKWVYWVFFAFLIYLIFELLRKILAGSLIRRDCHWFVIGAEFNIRNNC